MIGNYGVPDRTRRDEMVTPQSSHNTRRLGKECSMPFNAHLTCYQGLPKGFESNQIHAAALIVQDYSQVYG